jgi:hypothetical protein
METIMKTFAKLFFGAALLTGGALAVSGPASAQTYDHYGSSYGSRYGDQSDYGFRGDYGNQHYRGRDDWRMERYRHERYRHSYGGYRDHDHDNHYGRDHDRDRYDHRGYGYR